MLLASPGWLAGGCSFDVGGLSEDGGGAPPDAAHATIDGPIVSFPDAAHPIDASLDQPGTVPSTPSPGGLSMDADPSDWSGADWQYFDIADAAARVNCVAGYDDSISVRYASMHDSTYLYFYFAVTDDYLTNDGPNLFDDDAVVIYLDAAGDKSGPYGWDDHKFALSDGYWQDYATSASSLELNGDYSTTDAGFDFEIRIRKDSLGASPLPTRLGFDLMLSDDDTWGETDCWGYWYIAPGPHCGTCCEGDSTPGCDTTTMGSLALL